MTKPGGDIRSRQQGRAAAAALPHGRRVLMKGNEAIAEAAIRAGCDAYFGYPITPQAELLEWMARRMPEEGRVFVQAESELAAINMALGAAATGARVLVSSSSPGISLMAEAMSYMAASEVPVVLVNVMRGGPGLGSIGPSQSRLLPGRRRATATGTTGSRCSRRPRSARRWRSRRTRSRSRSATGRRSCILADGILGQAMEPVELTFREPPRIAAEWALSGADGRPPRVVRSLHLKPEDLEVHNLHLQAKYATIAASRDAPRRRAPRGRGPRRRRLRDGRPRRADRRGPGTCRGDHGRPLPADHACGPSPRRPSPSLPRRVRGLLVVEMSAGQMVEDVRLAVEGRVPVAFTGRTGGMVPTPAEVVEALRRLDQSTRRPLPVAGPGIDEATR